MTTSRRSMFAHAWARAGLALSLLLLSAIRPGTGLAADAGPAPAGVRLVSSDRSGVVLDVEVPSPELESVTAPNGAFTRLGLDGYGTDARHGHPLLPVASLWIAVPEGAELTLEAGGKGERLFDGLRLLPQQELPRASAAEGMSAIVP